MLILTTTTYLLFHYTDLWDSYFPAFQRSNENAGTSSSHTITSTKFPCSIKFLGQILHVHGYFVGQLIFATCPHKTYIILYVHIYSICAPQMLCQELGHEYLQLSAIFTVSKPFYLKLFSKFKSSFSQKQCFLVSFSAHSKLCEKNSTFHTNFTCSNKSIKKHSN